MKILVALLTFPMIFAVSTLTMIHGWGLEPFSWGWIVGGFIAIVFIQLVVEALR